MATAKAKPAAQEKTEEEKLDEQIAVFEPVAKSVKRKLNNPVYNEQREYVQHEMGFLTKLKFFRLMSNTIRLSAEGSGSSGVADVLGELMDAGSGGVGNPESLLEGILRLVELSPDFITETYIYALGAKPEDELWLRDALEALDDDTGLDILDVFVAQNGESIYDFLTKKLPKVGKRIQHVARLDQEQSETTT